MRAFRRVPEGLVCGLDDWERELLAQGDNAAAEAPETSEAPAKTESE